MTPKYKKNNLLYHKLPMTWIEFAMCNMSSLKCLCLRACSPGSFISQSTNCPCFINPGRQKLNMKGSSVNTGSWVKTIAERVLSELTFRNCWYHSGTSWRWWRVCLWVCLCVATCWEDHLVHSSCKNQCSRSTSGKIGVSLVCLNVPYLFWTEGHACHFTTHGGC